MVVNPTRYAAPTSPKVDFSAWKDRVINTTAPRTKFGTDVVTVALRFVPNCSEAIVTKTAQ